MQPVITWGKEKQDIAVALLLESGPSFNQSIAVSMNNFMSSLHPTYSILTLS